MSKRVSIEDNPEWDSAGDSRATKRSSIAVKTSGNVGSNNQKNQCRNESSSNAGATDCTALWKALDIVLESGMLEVKDLGNLMAVSKTFSHNVRGSVGCWAPFLVVDTKGYWPKVPGGLPKLGLAVPFGRISMDDWPGPLNPGKYGIFEMSIPERPHGDVYEPYRSNYPHPSEASGVAKGLCLPSGKNCLRFNENTGVLEDIFYAVDDTILSCERPFPTAIYIRRELPIVCDACSVTCTSYPSLVQHCLTVEHQDATMVPEEAKIPKEFWDPRNKAGFEDMTPFEQVQACLKYKHKVIQALRAPLDAAGRRKMRELHEAFRPPMIARGHLPEYCTLEKVTKGIVEAVVDSFQMKGMLLTGHCRYVLHKGWGHFEFAETSDLYRENINHFFNRFAENIPKMDPPEYSQSEGASEDDNEINEEDDTLSTESPDLDFWMEADEGHGI